MSPGRLIPWLAFLLMRPIAKEVGGREKPGAVGLGQKTSVEKYSYIGNYVTVKMKQLKPPIQNEGISQLSSKKTS